MVIIRIGDDMDEKVRHKYEIRNRDGLICMSYNDERCNYPEPILRSMREAGYKIYVDGKLSKAGNTKNYKKGGTK